MRKSRKAAKHFKNEEFLAVLGAYCRQLRKKRGLSVNRMAREGDKLSPSVIIRLESGSGAVSVLALLRYAEVLGVPPKKLLDFPFADDWGSGDT